MKIYNKIIILIATMLFAYSFYHLFFYVSENVYQEKQYNIIQEKIYSVKENKQNLQETIEQPNINFDNERYIRQNNLLELKNQNTDLQAWIRIKDTKIDYPVMQNLENPDFYLKRNFDKKKSSLGSIYIDASCDIDNSKNIVLYGHHMKSGKMFAFLNKYDKIEIVNQYNIVEFDTLNRLQDYQIIASFKIKSNEIDELQKYLSMNDEQEFNNLKDFIKRHQFFDINIDYSYNDSFLTLMTCEYTNKDGRFFVLCKRIKSTLQIKK